MKNFVTNMARNNIFANLLMMIVFVSGFLGIMSMNRELLPNASVNFVEITMPYPGATPAEIEEGICQRFEEAVEGIEGVKDFYTTAAEGLGMGFAEVDESADEQTVMDDIRAQVNAVTTFPRNAEKPIVNLMLYRIPVCRICLAGDIPQRQLKETAEKIKDELLAIPKISQVSVGGVADYEIAIEISEEKLRRFGLTFDEVAARVQRECLNLPGGFVRTSKEDFKIRAMGRRYRGEEFADLVVLTRPDGTIIRLDRIAEINDGFEEDPIVGHFNGERAALIIVFKTEEEDAIAISEAVDGYIAAKDPTFPPGLTLTKWGDTSRMIRERIKLLNKNGMLGLALVFGFLWLFLGLRLGFWVAMGIPISLLGSMAIVAAHGKTINMISLFGLIMVLGIIVDDAIVVGESISLHRRMGKSPMRAAIDGTLEVFWPVLAAVFTSMAAFLPLFYVSGVMGKFIAILPMVVIAALAVSLIECFFLLPAHLNHLPAAGAPTGSVSFLRRKMMLFREGMERLEERFVKRVYEPFAALVVRWRYPAIASSFTVLLVMAGAFSGGFIKFTLMPDSDEDMLLTRVEFPDGTPVSVTRGAVRKLEEGLKAVSDRMETTSGKPLVNEIFSLTGSYSDYVAVKGGNIAEMLVELLPSEERNIYFETINEAWEEEVGELEGALSLSFGSIEHGPPGKSIEVWFLGDDYDECLAAAGELEEKLASYRGVYEIENDFRPGKTELHIRLKPRAYSLGFTLDDVGRQLRQGFYGAEPVRIQRGRDDVRIKVRYPLDERRSLAELESIRIRAPGGEEVPFVSVADMELTRGLSTIHRKKGQRRVSVTAEVKPELANAREVLVDLQKDFLPGIERRYPGVITTIEGEQQDSRESMESLFSGFILALLLIYLILSTIFRSYFQPLIILFTVPFGLVGALVGHLFMNLDISLMSLFGMVALTGIVVNDAIVLIECINNKIADGTPFFQALKEGGGRRFRAIMLTSITTCAGLFPLIAERSVQARFLIPMALSIASGVVAATLLTLFLVPCLMAALNDGRVLVRWVRTGKWESREAVEPAATRKTNGPDRPIEDQPCC
jgi:multidrug efflux pump subunit AcrB